MTAKKIIILVLSLLSVAAVVLGLCLFFLANRVIIAVPDSVSIEKIDQDFFLTTEFCEGNQYCFKLEQKIGENQFLLVDMVKSDTNKINLSAQKNIDLGLGTQFRFSACYATENDAGNSEFCKPILWSPKKTLAGVNYDSVTVNLEQNKITWDEVDDATSYVLKFFDADGNCLTFPPCKTNSFSLVDQNGRHKLGAGAFKLFIIADNENVEYLPSNAGDGLKDLVEIEIKNEIVSVFHSATSFAVSCTQLTRSFSVIIDENLKYELKISQEPIFDGNFFVYDLLQNLEMLRDFDFSRHTVKIVALQDGMTLESDPFEVN